MELVDPDKEKFARAAHLKGIAVTAAVLALPALNKDLAWLHGLVPLPVFYYLVSLGQKQGIALIATGILIAGVVTALLGTLPVLLFALSLVPLGFILARAAERHEPPTLAGLKGVFFLASAWVLVGLLYGAARQVNIYQEILHGLDQGLAATFEQYRQSSGLAADTIEEIGRTIERLRLLLNRSFPAVIVTSIVWTVWLNLAAGHWLLQKKDPSLTPWGKLRKWRLPESLVWLVVAAAAALLVPAGALNTVGLNMGLVAFVLYFMQGLAVLSGLLAKWGMPYFFKAMIYILLLVQIYGIMLLALLGLLDVWLDLSRRQRNNTGT